MFDSVLQWLYHDYIPDHIPVITCASAKIKCGIHFASFFFKNRPMIATLLLTLSPRCLWCRPLTSSAILTAHEIQPSIAIARQNGSGVQTPDVAVWHVWLLALGVWQSTVSVAGCGVLYVCRKSISLLHVNKLLDTGNLSETPVSLKVGYTLYSKRNMLVQQ